MLQENLRVLAKTDFEKPELGNYAGRSYRITHGRLHGLQALEEN